MDVVCGDKSLTVTVIPVRLSALSARAGFRKQKILKVDLFLNLTGTERVRFWMKLAGKKNL